MIPRTLQTKLLALANKFQVITLTGPRQSGKTTLVKATFPSLPYVSLEDPDVRQFALDDPRGFLINFPAGAVLDEVQHTPDLFSYIQTTVDQNRTIQFILTGSSNFLLMERISQTLAGRTAILHLLPLSMPELTRGGYTFQQYESLLFNGQYPRTYDRDIAPTDFFPAYTQTYVERDVRLMKNIGDMNSFIRFVQLCAGRVGQLLNYSSLANDAGLSPNTAKEWLSVLETSYIVYRLQPFHQNFSKRLVKSPKLYFYDTGLACSLLGIKDAGQLTTHFLKGSLFENLILNEWIKAAFNRGERPRLYFWRDSHGKEIDCVVDTGQGVIPIEIKAGKTLSSHFFKHIAYWRQLSQSKQPGYVVYGGEKSLTTGHGKFVSWKDIAQLTELAGYAVN